MADEQSTYVFMPIINAKGEAGITPMDPRLQKLIAFRQRGLTKLATSSTAGDEVAVIAKVTDLQAWENLSEVSPGAVIGGQAADNTAIVTARLPISRLEHVRAHPFVKSLKAAKRLSQKLVKTTAEILADPVLLPPGMKSKGGQGAIVGIVDYGCDFAHDNFLTDQGQTRLKLLWDQNGTGGGSGTFNYGTVYTPAQINAALKQPDPYTALGYGPDPGEPAHGTHVMDIASGNGRGTGVPGVAPAADIIFVQAACSDIPWQGIEVVKGNFGDSVQLLEALSFIFSQAGSTPCAINVSLGTNGGPHDGTTLVEQGIDRLVRQAPNRAVVIAASNSYADGIHATGSVPPNGQFDLPWIIEPGDQSENEMEIWYSGNTQLGVEIITPDGAHLSVPPGQEGTFSKDGNIVLFVANRLNDPNNHDNLIDIYLRPAQPGGGSWIVRLLGDPHQAVEFHAWVERDDYGQSYFPDPVDNTHTIGSISCGHDSIVVGSYDAHKPLLPLSFFSSSGPTRDGRLKPEISAPGHDVMAARSLSKNGVTRKSGTSMAAPAVTGAIALMLAEAKAQGHTMSIDQIRQALLGTARRNPPPGGDFDLRFGNGRVSAKGLVESA